MKRFLILTGFFISGLIANAQVTFQKTYAGFYTEFGFAKQTIDGGYIMTGNGPPTGGAGGDACLVKTDAYGNKLWGKSYGGPAFDCGYCVQQTTDGGFIVTGRTNSFGSGNDDVYLIKTDSIGNLIWSRAIGGIDNDYGSSVLQTSDGGYIVVGSTTNFSGSIKDVYIIRTDSIGNLLWTKTIADSYGEIGYSIQQTSDGGYIICGGADNQAGDGGVLLIKLDVSGNLLWLKIYGGEDGGWGYSVQQTTDGGYIIAGAITFNTGTFIYQDDVLLLKTDSVGNLMWSKAFGGPKADRAFWAQQTSDGGFIVTGSYCFIVNFYYTYLIKTDANGDTLWTKGIGATGYEEGDYIQQTTDGGYAISGFDYGDFYLIKTDTNGNVSCNQHATSTTVTIPALNVTSPTMLISSVGTAVVPATVVANWGIENTLCTSIGMNEAITDNSFSIYPNPFNQELIVSSHEFAADNLQLANNKTEIKLFDIYGRTVLSQPLTTVNTKLQTSTLSPGIYIYEVRNNNGIFKTGKVVKE